MSRTFSTNCGSVESLNVSVRCGCSENARQMRCTEEAETPDAFAMSRVLQCVAPVGFSSSVLTTMASIWSSPICIGFFSYAPRDDRLSDGALAGLRKRIHHELELRFGCEFRLWQLEAAFPAGPQRHEQVQGAIGESQLFIPMVTPSA